jgi:endoglucanase
LKTDDHLKRGKTKTQGGFMLQVKNNQIVDDQGKAIRLRGTCVGGWMNMENFINGYPGDEHGQRSVMAQVLGAGKARFFFDRWLDYVFAEEDVAYLKSLGATVVRLPLNYRHFESDAAPFKYLEAGFARLDQAVQWCAKHHLYVILDLHSVQGWQNTDWHCDNSSRHTHFWQHPHFQDRFVALWEEFARRYAGSSTIAGYNVMNEPVTNAPAGRFLRDEDYPTDWETFNRIYRRVVQAIRIIDPDHIIFLEGDYFAQRFAGLDAPFASNLVYSSHNYTAATFDSRQKPISVTQRRQNRQRQEELFLAHQGAQFMQKHSVPLWVGEFGGEGGFALDDQVNVFEAYGAHWTTWTYKDIGAMGLVVVDPASEYMRCVAPVLNAKRELGVESWLSPGLPGSLVTGAIHDLAGLFEKSIGDPSIHPEFNRRYLAQHALGGYAASLMQPAFAKCFKDLSETEIDRVLQSFALKNCQPRQDMVEVIRKYCAQPVN